MGRAGRPEREIAARHPFLERARPGTGDASRAGLEHECCYERDARCPCDDGDRCGDPVAASRPVNAEDLRFAEDLHTYTTVKSPQSGKSPHYLADRNVRSPPQPARQAHHPERAEPATAGHRHPACQSRSMGSGPLTGQRPGGTPVARPPPRSCPGKMPGRGRLSMIACSCTPARGNKYTQSSAFTSFSRTGRQEPAAHPETTARTAGPFPVKCARAAVCPFGPSLDATSAVPRHG
jgi:hypothetical protein